MLRNIEFLTQLDNIFLTKITLIISVIIFEFDFIIYSIYAKSNQFTDITHQKINNSNFKHDNCINVTDDFVACFKDGWGTEDVSFSSASVDIRAWVLTPSEVIQNDVYPYTQSVTSLPTELQLTSLFDSDFHIVIVEVSSRTLCVVLLCLKQCTFFAYYQTTYKE